ncbi:MAG: SRPBCC family protein [Intrasporangium sp.]|uniref:SRPBCC family protein n=1 Tax=Intrasporangium sp. TaxID=1925024 RepID=UPI0026482B4D|nr:SRPBCC family protein [Intrasporangium sp.]MDN5796479.1 SRPBCC family protein [Intrasporangium sp.]
MPGDEFLPHAPQVATRAITIDAPPNQVWPWIAQLGQGRGGLYSYDWLENLVGCDIHSVDRIEPEWQTLAVGDEVRLHPKSALTVAAVESAKCLVLRPGPLREPTAESMPGDVPFDFTWAFVLRQHPGRQTRLVVRERYEPRVGKSGSGIEVLAAVGAVMGIKMLRGIKERAEAPSN